MLDINPFVEKLNKEIEAYNFGDTPPELYEPLSYILSLGGKRIRPLLVLLGYRIFKEDWQTITKPSLAVEVFHNFSLMHDDIMDNAPLRRGQATVHEKWNTNLAILSGDVMLVKAYDLLLEADNFNAEILKSFNETARLVCEGQQFDMNFETRDTVSEAEYIEMIKLKTAVLLGFSLQYGAMLAGASIENQKALYNFGTSIGIGFQLKDDLLDVYGEQAKVGKQVGGDIISNKKTFLLLKAIEKASGDTKLALSKWIKANEFDNKEKVEAVKSIYNELGIKAITEEQMDFQFNKGFTSLDQVNGNTVAIEELRVFAKYLIHREE